jgi:hypothetical protein
LSFGVLIGMSMPNLLRTEEAIEDHFKGLTRSRKTTLTSELLKVVP